MKSLELLLQGISMDILLNISTGHIGYLIRSPYSLYRLYVMENPRGFMENPRPYRKLEMISSVITIPPFI